MVAPVENLLTNTHELPVGHIDLDRFEEFIRKKKAFTFVRFSDGEIEILRNRRLVIADGITEFRGKTFRNSFLDFDKKTFCPENGGAIRKDLLASAMYKNNDYYKGIPTAHNNAIDDREFLLRLNGGFTQQMTFSDLFFNSNFMRARLDFFPAILEQFSDFFMVGNWRCRLSGILSKGNLIKIPDNFFSSYKDTLKTVLSKLILAPESALVLSSASSLSNVLGYKLYQHRPDITFLDIGSGLNDLIGLSSGKRAYHKLIHSRKLRERLAAWRYRWNREYQLKW